MRVVLYALFTIAAARGVTRTAAKENEDWHVKTGRQTGRHAPCRDDWPRAAGRRARSGQCRLNDASPHHANRIATAERAAGSASPRPGALRGRQQVKQQVIRACASSRPVRVTYRQRGSPRNRRSLRPRTPEGPCQARRCSHCARRCPNGCRRDSSRGVRPSRRPLGGRRRDGGPSVLWELREAGAAARFEQSEAGGSADGGSAGAEDGDAATQHGPVTQTPGVSGRPRTRE